MSEQLTTPKRGYQDYLWPKQRSVRIDESDQGLEAGVRNPGWLHRRDPHCPYQDLLPNHRLLSRDKVLQDRCHQFPRPEPNGSSEHCLFY